MVRKVYACVLCGDETPIVDAEPTPDPVSVLASLRSWIAMVEAALDDGGFASGDHAPTPLEEMTAASQVIESMLGYQVCWSCNRGRIEQVDPELLTRLDMLEAFVRHPD